jgi:N-acetylneuraminic acid mutarotase
MRRVITVLVILAVLTALCIMTIRPAWAAEDSWTTKAPMHKARNGLGVAVVNGKIYAIGGNRYIITGYNSEYLGTNEEYDPATDTWTFKKPMPTPRCDFAIAVFQDKIYCIGGYRGNGVTGVNEVYDPATDSWTMKTSIPNIAANYASAVVNDKIYIIGGLGYGAISESHDLNQVYDAKTDTWSSAALVPETAVYNAAAGATTGVNAPKRIYVIGGYYRNTADFDIPYNRKPLIYNPENDTWMEGAPMPTNRSDIAVAVVDDKLYVVGGTVPADHSYIEVADNLEYTPVGYGTPDPSYVPLNNSAAPEIAVLSPENQTYYATDIPLNLIVNEPDCWISYELDGQTVGAFSGNASLTSLSQGAHTLTVYATDAAGNTGTSMTIYFTVTPLPLWLIIAVVFVAVVGVGLLVYFRKRKH